MPEDERERAFSLNRAFSLTRAFSSIKAFSHWIAATAPTAAKAILVKLGIAVCLTGSVMPLQAENRHYPAELVGASWHILPSVFECKLSQSIPDFGEAVFYHQAGEPLIFKLQATNTVMGEGPGSLVSQPPPWMHGVNEKPLGSMVVTGGQTPVKLEQKMADVVMAELRAGKVPMFTGPASFNPRLPISVQVSPAQFTLAYADYQRCLEHLLPVNFAQVGRSTIHWQEGSPDLDDNGKQVLDNIVLYAKSDPSITGFEVDSFTDTAGDRMDNLRLSERRAFLVTNYLISKGLDSTTIITRAHGEREEYLLVKNEKNAADRNRNRRVNIVLLRSGS